MRAPGIVAAGLLTAALLIPPGVALGVAPELPRTVVDTTYVAPTGRTIAVAAAGDFQAALDAAQPGDQITLEAGASFIGNFTLPNKSGEGWIIVRTSAPDSALPAPGIRITPAYVSALPKIISPNANPALTAAPGAHHYRFIGVEFTVSPGVVLNYQLILLGNRPASLAEVPHDLIFDRVYIHGNSYVDLRRGIALNSAASAVIDSYIADAHEVSSDSQAIAGWDGPGPFKIVNNYLEGAGENLMFGGADPSLEALVPSDIEIRRNHFYKPLWWRAGDPSYAGIHWTIKNLLELKNAQRVLIDANVFENNWQAAQGGTAIVFTVRNQEGTAPWSVVQDVTFTNNIVRHTGGAIGMHGWDDIYPSQQSARFLIKNNLLDDVNSATWGGSGWLFSAFRGLVDLQIEHNTGFMDQAVMMAGAATHTGFIYRNNLTPMGVYGFTGVSTQQGVNTLDTYFPGSLFEGNLLVGAAPELYPANNFFPASLTGVGFVDFEVGNYRLSAVSPYKNAGTDGTDIGADIDAIEAATAGVRTPRNPSPPPPETRFEESEQAVAYAGDWALLSSPQWSGGAAGYSATAGAQATFTFTGTSVSWVGFRGPMAGIARVMLDGALLGDVDLFAPTNEFRVVVFTATDLAAARHTLTIEVTGLKNAESTNTAIVVDAFDVPAPTVARFQETDPVMTYTTGWTQDSTSWAWSGGSAVYSRTVGAQATFTFTGTSVSWIGYRGPQAGIARVVLDGVLVGDVDLFASTPQPQVLVFSAKDLAAAPHTLTIEVTGLTNAAATDIAIVVDAFEVTSSSPQTTVSYFEETNPSVAYTTGWALHSSPQWSGGAAGYSATAGVQATFTFTGTSVRWIGLRGPLAGIARVVLDGVSVGDVDTFAPTHEFRAVVFTRTGLAPGSHTLAIEVTGQKNPASTDVFIVVDAFDVSN